jgi:outer membrane protein
MRLLPLVVALTLVPAALMAEDSLSLEQARTLAVRQHPRLAAARFLADAAERRIAEYRSLYYPVITAVGTAAAAHDGLARLAAGALNAPTVYDRVSLGVQASQLVTDFGQTRSLNAGAEQHARAALQEVDVTRDELLFDVDQAFYSLCEARELLKVAQASVAARKLVADRVTELAKNHLKSDLDAGFARVQLLQGELLLTQAEDGIADRMIDLGDLIGRPVGPATILVEPAGSAPTSASADSLVQEAMVRNPEIMRLSAAEEEQRSLARAAFGQANPRLSLVGSAGVTPVHDPRLTDNYAAGAVNLSIPLFNGSAYVAQRDEALDQARALERERADYELKLGADIRSCVNRLGYLGQEISTDRQMSDQTHQAYRLAAARYQTGSSSMVELVQAQLELTQAEIDLTKALFSLRIEQARIDYDLGRHDDAAR